MATPKQLAANRRNAQKSTGPRTAEGKAQSARNGARSRGPKALDGKSRSRWNALKHGLRAATLIPEPLQDRESPQEFEALHEALRDELKPATPFAEMLVHTIAACYWRLSRVYQAEGYAIAAARSAQQADIAIFGQAALELEPGIDLPLPTENATLPRAPQAELILRYEAHLERQIRHAYDLLERIERRHQAPPHPPDKNAPAPQRTPPPSPAEPAHTPATGLSAERTEPNRPAPSADAPGVDCRSPAAPPRRQQRATRDRGPAPSSHSTGDNVSPQGFALLSPPPMLALHPVQNALHSQVALPCEPGAQEARCHAEKRMRP